MNKKIWLPKLNYYSKRLSMWQEKLWREVNGKPFMGILDNIAGRKYFEYATFGRSGIQQSNSKLFEMNKQYAVSSFPYGNISAAGAADTPALDTTITTMGSQVYDADTSGDWRVYGYTSGVDRYSYGNFGAIGAATYTDGGSTSRTISGIYYHEPGAPTQARTDDLVLSLNATSIANTDTTFVSLEYNGQTYTRASATYNATLGSCSSWTWANINPDGPTTGTPAVKIFV